jgi:ABC-type nitrate/sulfonate/bicarbonate transport system permease component
VRALTAAGVTLGGVLVSQVYPPVYLAAVGICAAAFVALLRVTLSHPAIASLRHATLGAGAALVVAIIIGLLLAFATDLPLDVRVQLRVVILAAVTAPALYWLLLLVSGGFEEAR